MVSGQVAPGPNPKTLSAVGVHPAARADPGAGGADTRSPDRPHGVSPELADTGPCAAPMSRARSLGGRRGRVRRGGWPGGEPSRCSLRSCWVPASIGRGPNPRAWCIARSRSRSRNHRLRPRGRCRRSRPRPRGQRPRSGSRRQRCRIRPSGPPPGYRIRRRRRCRPSAVPPLGRPTRPRRWSRLRPRRPLGCAPRYRRPRSRPVLSSSRFLA